MTNIPSFEDYARDIMQLRYSHTISGRKETWEQIARRVCYYIVGKGKPSSIALPRDVYISILEAIINRKFIPAGRILRNTGFSYHQTDNCFTLRAEDTREGWAQLAYKCTMMFMSGGGVGVSYDNIRPYGCELTRSGGISSGPVPLVQMINSIGAAARQGGERRGAIYASLVWDHTDTPQFIHMKDNGGLDHTNISVRFDSCFFEKLNTLDNETANAIFNDTLRNACMTGDPGFQFDTDTQILRNACTEIISADDCDSCCLGAVNIAAINSLEELADIVQLGVIFLLCNTEYTHCPVPEVRKVKVKNRRIGLELMGIGEWFIQRNQPYGTLNSGIQRWLQVYKDASEHAAKEWSSRFSMNTPVAVRAIGPTGTISIVGGHTTPGIEPVFHTAYQRCYNTLKSKNHNDGYVKQRVIDPIVVKWLEQGYDVNDIDTAYTLSKDIAGISRRIAFQAFVQQYVDQGISSTVNLPCYTEGIEQKIAPVLLQHLPSLRGITFYPDGAKGSQPVTPIDIADVIKNDAVSIQESTSCKGGICSL